MCVPNHTKPVCFLKLLFWTSVSVDSTGLSVCPFDSNTPMCYHTDTESAGQFECSQRWDILWLIGDLECSCQRYLLFFGWLVAIRPHSNRSSVKWALFQTIQLVHRFVLLSVQAAKLSKSGRVCLHTFVTLYILSVYSLHILWTILAY